VSLNNKQTYKLILGCNKSHVTGFRFSQWLIDGAEGALGSMLEDRAANNLEIHAASIFRVGVSVNP
jgi:hypothetical protein